jgi:hypothetical protein
MASDPKNSEFFQVNSPGSPEEEWSSPLEQWANNLPSEDDDWETVNFPDAINIDNLTATPASQTVISQTVISQTVINSSPASQENQQKPETRRETSLNLSNLADENFTTEQLQALTEQGATIPPTMWQALHECNRNLVNRLTDLEVILETNTQNLKLQENLLKEKNQHLLDSQRQVNRLFYKLELCQQVIQRQEVMVENLTEKWQQSQQQQAQLERECAIAQQKYNEQSYHLQELENICQELRSRLQRQQRQTLQFKVALEKTLPKTAAFAEADKTVNIQEQINLISTLTAPPVQPWLPDNNKEVEEILSSPIERQIWLSIHQNHQINETLPDSTNVVSYDLQNNWQQNLQNISSGKSTEEHLLEDLTINVTHQQMTETEEPSVKEAEKQQKTGLDLPWFMKTLLGEEHDAINYATPNSVAENSSLSSLSNLATDIAPVTKNIELDTDTVLAERVVTTADDLNRWSENQTASAITSVNQEINIATTASTDHNLHNPFLDAIIEDTAEPLEILETMIEGDRPATSQLSWNIPIVNPQPEKKRRSLASIDLPSFPPIGLYQPSLV